MNTTHTDPCKMAIDLLLESPKEIESRCHALKLDTHKSKTKMIDSIIIKTFGIEAVRAAFARRR